MAVTHLDYLLNLYNCCDPVLKRYHCALQTLPCDSDRLLGHVHRGLGGSLPSGSSSRMCATSCQHSHEVNNYFKDRCLLQRIRDVLFWQSVRGDVVGTADRSSTAREPT